MKRVVFLLSLLAGVVSCGGDETSSPADTPKKPSEKAVLKSPDNNKVCIENPVVFSWKAVENATTYELKIVKSDGTVYSSFTLSNLAKTVRLPKGRSYSWQIVAKNDFGETFSETRNFVTEGESMVNFIPTATITIDSDKKEVKISFYDTDKDRLTYKVYYSLESTFQKKAVLKEHNNNTVSSEDVVFVKTMDFSKDFWIKVVVVDDKGNQSTSIKGFNTK